MTWFGRHRLSAAEALELELAGTVTDSSAAELLGIVDLLTVTDLLRAAARDLPPPGALRARRRDLVALAVSASAGRIGQPTRRGGRLIRAPMIALAATIIAVASVLGATLVMSWLDASSRHLTPPSISQPAADPEPAADPDPSTGPPAGASPQPHASQSEPPGFTNQGSAGLPADLSAELLAQLQVELQAACGEETALPDLKGLDQAEARALVDAVIAACETVLATPSPVETPAVLPADLSAELQAGLQAELQAACGEEATLPDLSGLDEAEARALTDALIAACEAVPGTLLP